MTDTFKTPLASSLRAGNQTEKMFFLAPPGLAKVVTQAAAMHGRGISAECRVALEIHGARSLLAALDDPEIQERLGDGAEQFERDLRADIAAMEARAYSRPSVPSFLDADAA